MKHLDLFSGIKKDREVKVHSPCGLLVHGRWDIKSTPWLGLYSSLTSKNHSYYIVVCEQYLKLWIPHMTGNLEGHQDNAEESASYYYQDRSFLLSVGRIVVFFAGYVHRIWNVILSHFSLRIPQSNVADCYPFAQQSRIVPHIAYNALLSVGRLHVFYEQQHSGICESNIYAKEFQPQIHSHRQCNTLFCLPQFPSWLDCIIKYKMCQGEGVDATCQKRLST